FWPRYDFAEALDERAPSAFALPLGQIERQRRISQIRTRLNRHCHGRPTSARAALISRQRERASAFADALHLAPNWDAVIRDPKPSSCDGCCYCPHGH